MTLKKWSYTPDSTTGPLVSVIIPARNEEQTISGCLTSLLHQKYKNYEILVLDDNSTDNTWPILKEFQKKSDKIRIFAGLPLAEHWSGKQYACHQLVKEAKGEFLLFTDADTVHSPFSISWAVSNLKKHHADFLSGYIYHVIGSWGEALIVPAAYLLTTLILPLCKIPGKNHPFISFAIGQFIFCKKDVFQAIGGYSLCKQSVVEDMDLARIIKTYGYKTIFLDAKEYVRCRMYTSYVSAFHGFVKNIFGALNKNSVILAGFCLLIILGIEFPVVHLIHILLKGTGDLLSAGLPVGIFFCTWSLVIKDRKLSPFIAFLYPLLFVNIFC
ncbi:MAG: glycosyltransferase, partial [Spirochaetales bacterium]|nr:glycosyltransferase [Spirochaetales bacterium]